MSQQSKKFTVHSKEEEGNKTKNFFVPITSRPRNRFSRLRSIINVEHFSSLNCPRFLSSTVIKSWVQQRKVVDFSMLHWLL